MSEYRKSWLILLVVALAFMAGGFFFFVGSILRLALPQKPIGDLAIIEVLGGIFDPKDTVELLEEARKNKAVRAVVLRVDSPGGSVSASQEIFEAVQHFKGTKPIVASMGTVAASGGYYISAPASKIVANAGTVTGSIGVRMEYINIQDLMGWARLRPVTLKSGEMKDIGSPTRDMTAQEKEYLEKILREMHDQFKKAVSESRGITPEEMEKVGDGRILTGEEALKSKLIDAIGGLETAIRLAGELAKIAGEPEIFYLEKKKEPWQALIDGVSESMVNRWMGLMMSPIRLSY